MKEIQKYYIIYNHYTYLKYKYFHYSRDVRLLVEIHSYPLIRTRYSTRFFMETIQCIDCRFIKIMSKSFDIYIYLRNHFPIVNDKDN